MSLFTARLDSHARALDLLAQRQKILGSNIANADTPGFKARDFDFAAALTKARAEVQGDASQMGASQAGHLDAGGATAVGTGPGAVDVSTVDLLWRNPEQPSLDGNTVDLDRERATFADNAMRYEATLRFINNDVRTMLSAITGQ